MGGIRSSLRSFLFLELVFVIYIYVHVSMCKELSVCEISLAEWVSYVHFGKR